MPAFILADLLLVRATRLTLLRQSKYIYTWDRTDRLHIAGLLRMRPLVCPRFRWAAFVRVGEPHCYTSLVYIHTCSTICSYQPL